MIINTVSIPFYTRTKTGFTHLEVMNRNEFLSLTQRVSSKAENIWDRSLACPSRPIFGKKDISYLIVLPKRISIDFANGSLINGKLILVSDYNRLYIGFIPLTEEGATLVQYQSIIKQFHHHQLDAIPGKIERKGASEKGKSLFELHTDIKLKRTLNTLVLNDASLMLLVDDKNNTLALLCCRRSIPSPLPVPVLYLQPKSLLEGRHNLHHIEIPCLLDRQLGYIKIPCLSKEDFEQKMHQSAIFRQSFIEGKGYRHKVNPIFWKKNHLLVLPHGCCVESKQVIKGGDLFLIQGSQLELGFIPMKGDKKVERTSLFSFHRSLLDGVNTTNQFVPAGRCSRLTLGQAAKLSLTCDSKPCISGVSLFLLASKDTNFMALLCQDGDLDLKGINPLHPQEGFLPLNKWIILPEVEQEGAPPKKRSREEDEPGTSAQAIRESLPFFIRPDTSALPQTEIIQRPNQHIIMQDHTYCCTKAPEALQSGEQSYLTLSREAGRSLATSEDEKLEEETRRILAAGSLLALANQSAGTFSLKSSQDHPS
ncbi:hypothetical protein [Candidatus Similichlamydia laticola]|uniref:Uncharacterized protein n=1 Tax=Candidatus Similichlamydia laticola TaxID=2170265 RepID=A0A369KFD3_9BACT|nr:hypothetical protein [Candidatus Similichlamydia laticola]RDB31607.1 hypothetical protein HAT2_00286 [Candidatus Similichlamydia laticola]